MRHSLILAAALLSFAAPAFAQDRTLPAGDFNGAQTPVDRSIGFDALAQRPTATFESRSVSSSLPRADRPD